MIIAFTGHRPPKLIGGYDIYVGERFHVAFEWIQTQLTNSLKELQPTKAISGMALGVDTWAAKICVELNIPFIAAIPFEGQEKRWSKQDQNIYNQLLEKAEKVITVSNGGYKPSAYQIRDEWMVDNADMVLAVFDGSKSGTKNTIDYAKKVGKEVHIIDANQRPIEMSL